MNSRRVPGVLAVAAVIALVAAFFVRGGAPLWSAVLGWLGRWWLVPVAAALAVAALVLALRGRPRAPATAEAPDRWSRIAALVTAFTALAALVFTALSLGATRDQIGLSEQGQVTDRYTKAVDQLGTPGADHLQIRLGGIYALERLATDSPRDQQTIVEVLAAFIRTTSPRADEAAACPKTPADVEAAFVVLTRRDVGREGQKVFAADLSRTCLTGISAPYADLSRMLLIKADLSGASLPSSHGALANLGGAKLTGAKLTGANLRGLLRLDHADLSGADLTKAKLGDLDHVRLTGADLSGADLGYTHLAGVDLTGARHDGGTDVRDAQHDASTTGAWW